jgi:hypothetical protein
MAYFSDLCTPSPVALLPEDLFFTPLLNRVHSITPGQSPASPTPRRSPLREVPVTNVSSFVDSIEEETTSFDDDEVSSNNTRFTSSISFRTPQGQLQEFASIDEAYNYVQAWAKTEGFAIKKGRTRKRPDKITVYHQTFHCVCGSSRHNSTQTKREGRSKNIACPWHCIIVEGGGTWRGHTTGHQSIVHHHPQSFGATYPVHRRQERQRQPRIQERIMADAQVKTITRKETHIALSKQFPGVEINLKDISNIQAKAQFQADDGLPTIQAMTRTMGEAF